MAAKSLTLGAEIYLPSSWSALANDYFDKQHGTSDAMPVSGLVFKGNASAVFSWSPGSLPGSYPTPFLVDGGWWNHMERIPAASSLLEVFTLALGMGVELSCTS